MIEELETYIRSVARSSGLFNNNPYEQQSLRDSISDAVFLCLAEAKNFECEIAYKVWICKTAINIYRNKKKKDAKLSLVDNEEIDKELYIHKIYAEIDDIRKEENYRDWLSEYCREEEIELLVNIYFHKFKLKEIAEMMDISEDAVQHKKKRLLVKLKIILSPPLNNLFILI